MLPRHVPAMLRDDGFYRAHSGVHGAQTESEYFGIKVRVLSAAKARAYNPGPLEVAISIRGTAEQPVSLSAKFRAVLSLVFEDTGAFATYGSHGGDNPRSITPEQSAAVAAFVHQYSDSKVLVIHCAAGVSRSRSLAAAVCDALRLPYKFTAVNDDVFRIVSQAFSRNPAPSPLSDHLRAEFDHLLESMQTPETRAATERGFNPSAEEISRAGAESIARDLRATQERTPVDGEALAGANVTRLALAPEILHGGTAEVILPEPPHGERWRVEWRLVGTSDWHVVAGGFPAGVYAVSDKHTPEPQHYIEWQAAAEVRGAESYCTVCGAPGAAPQGYSDPDLGPVSLCEEHGHRALDRA